MTDWPGSFRQYKHTYNLIYSINSLKAKCDMQGACHHIVDTGYKIHGNVGSKWSSNQCAPQSATVGPSQYCSARRRYPRALVRGQSLVSVRDSTAE